MSSSIVKVEQTDLGHLVQRRAELEEAVSDLRKSLKNCRRFDEALERKRRLESRIASSRPKNMRWQRSSTRTLRYPTDSERPKWS